MTGIDFEKLKITMSDRWKTTDKPIHFTHNFTDVRAKIDVKYDGKLFKNNSITDLQEDWQTG